MGIRYPRVGWVHTSSWNTSRLEGAKHRPLDPYGKTSVNPGILSSHFTKLHRENHFRKEFANGMPATHPDNVASRPGLISGDASTRS